MADETTPYWFITEIAGPTEADLNRPSRGMFQRRIASLNAVVLEAQINSLLQSVIKAFDQMEQETGLQLDEVELWVEINAVGQVSLIGSGASPDNVGAIKLKYKRANPRSSLPGTTRIPHPDDEPSPLDMPPNPSPSKEPPKAPPR